MLIVLLQQAETEITTSGKVTAETQEKLDKMFGSHDKALSTWIKLLCQKTRDEIQQQEKNPETRKDPVEDER